MNSLHRVKKLEEEYGQLLRARREYSVIIDNIHEDNEVDRYIIISANIPAMTKAEYEKWVRGGVEIH